MTKVPLKVKNKIKRNELYIQKRRLEIKEKIAKVKKRRKEEEKDPSKKEKRLAANQQKTLENTRDMEETFVKGDEEVLEEQKLDEFSTYFTGELPKVLLTTAKNTTSHIYQFMNELTTVFPNSEFVKRKGYEIPDIINFCKNRNYTDLLIVGEHHKSPNSLTLIHLPNGPTLHCKISSVKTKKRIRGHGTSTTHYPELILNNFDTRLGHQIGKFLGCLFPQRPEFQGRQVVTFHNQRDFIFFRRHRYAFESRDKANIQELGPRFTLKPLWLQRGLFDPEFGEYEWIYKPDLHKSRKKFDL